jgi:hypothetical protein
MKITESALEPYRVLILTGGSSGIGKAILKEALSIKTPLIIANLSRSKPDIKSSEREFKHFPTDLSRKEEIITTYHAVESWLKELGEDGPLLLINNSGSGCYGPFPEPDLETNLAMVDVNLRAVVHLTGLLLPRIRESRGGVVNICSTASFQPLSYMSAYAATKAFLLSWGLAIHQELAREGSFCCTLCPGPTATDFFDRAGLTGEPSGLKGETVEAVAKTTYRAILKRTSLSTSGRINWFLAGVGHTLPVRWVAPLTAKVIRGLRLEQFKKTDA